MHRGAILLAFAVVAAMECPGATLSAPSQTATPGQTIVAGVSLESGGGDLSGVQFDIQPAAAAAVRVLPGAQVGTSAKLIYTNELPDHAIRVLVVGMNAAVLRDGELARLVIAVDPSAAPGSLRLPITNALATDPDGTAVAVSDSAVDLRVEGAPVFSAFSAGAVLNGASLLPGPVSPGEIVTVFGSADLGRASSVLFNQAKAPILYAGPAQVKAIAPFALDVGRPAALELYAGETSLGAAPVETAVAGPAIFTSAGTGVGPGVILNQDSTPNSYDTPAAAGSIVSLYGTGFGALVPAANDGETAAGPAATALPVTALIGGMDAEVLYAGAAPGLVAGVVQVNVRVPARIAPSISVPVFLTIGGETTQPGVTLAVE